MPAIELSRGGWTAALGGSLLLHLALAVAAVPLLGSAEVRRAVTAITFSEPEIESLPAEKPSAPVSAALPDEIEALAPAQAAPIAQTAAVGGLPGLSASETAASPGVPQPAVPGAAEPLAPGTAERAAPTQEAAAALPERAADAVAPLGGATLPSTPPPLLQAETGDARFDAAQGEPAPAVGPDATLPAAPAASAQQPASAPASVSILSVETIIAADAAARSATPSGQVPDILAGAGAAAALPALAAAESAGAPAGVEAIDAPTVVEEWARPAAPPRRLAPAAPRIFASSGVAALLPPVAAAESAGAPAVDGATGLSVVVAGRARPGGSPRRILPDAPAIPLRAGEPGGPPTLTQILAGGRDAVVPEPAQRLVERRVAGLGPEPLRPLASAGGGMRPAGVPTVLSSLGSETGGGFGRGSAAWREAVGFVRGYGGDGCFAALPVEKGERVGLEAFGADGREVERFAQASARGLARPTEVLRGSLSTIQCSALRLARSSKLYPDFALSITLALPADEFDLVTGEILGAGTRAVQLLLIDETGQVQTVARYAPGPDGPLPFDFPFSREELADARGLFFAVASDKPLSNLDFDIKDMTAPTFFRLLEEESKSADAALDIAMVAFDLDANPAQASAQQ